MNMIDPIQSPSGIRFARMSAVFPTALALGALSLVAFNMHEIRSAHATRESERAETLERLAALEVGGQRLEAAVREAIEQLPVRLSVVDASTGTSVPVLRASLEEADRQLADIERTVATLSEDRLVVEDAAAISMTIRSLDRVRLSPLGPDVRDRIERLLWVADALEHVASPAGDPIADMARSRALASDPRNCSSALSAHLRDRIVAVRTDAEFRTASESAASIAAERTAIVSETDPATRVHRLESLANRVDLELADMSGFAAEGLRRVHDEAFAVERDLQVALKDLRNMNEMTETRELAAVIDARLAVLDRIEDPYRRVAQADREVAQASAEAAERISFHAEATEVLQAALDKVTAVADDARERLRIHRETRYREYVQQVEWNISRFESDFANADWKVLDWGVDEDAIARSFCANLAPIDDSRLPDSLKSRLEGAIETAYRKVNASHRPVLDQALAGRKSIRPE